MKFLIGLSFALNILTFVAIIWGLLGGIFYLINKTLIQPIYVRDVNQFELLGVQSKDTVFLGDSITEGGEWNELFPQSNARNRGIVGDTTTGILGRLDQVTKGQPAQIFLMIGINDIASNIPPKDIVANTIKIVERIHQDSPETEIFVQSILPNNDRLQKNIETINSELEKAIIGKATWINLYPLFLGEGGVSMSNTLSNDSAHLLGKGYLVWRDAIAHLVHKKKYTHTTPKPENF